MLEELEEKYRYGFTLMEVLPLVESILAQGKVAYVQKPTEE
jgi:hypothetical protein